MSTYLFIIQLILSGALVVVLLLQARGSSIGGIFGGSDSAIYRTRRGLEKTLFQITIGLSAVFLVFSFVIAVFARS